MSEPPVRPKSPELGEFGLEQTHLTAAIGARETAFRWLLIALVPPYLLLAGAMGAVGAVVVALLAAVPLALVGDKIGGWTERRCCRRLGVDPVKLANYREAESRYQKGKAEFDEWFGRSQRAFWLSLSPNQFEHEVGRLYRRLGYTAQVTKQSRDGGADVILRAEHGTTIVQCKAHQRKIGVRAFRELNGVMADFGAESAVLVCLHGATDDAWTFIRGKPIRVVMLNDLVQMSRELAGDVSENGGSNAARS